VVIWYVQLPILANVCWLRQPIQRNRSETDLPKYFFNTLPEVASALVRVLSHPPLDLEVVYISSALLLYLSESLLFWNSFVGHDVGWAAPDHSHRICEGRSTETGWCFRVLRQLSYPQVQTEVSSSCRSLAVASSNMNAVCALEVFMSQS
jgi:hypothetical protein